ncbi:MAG: nucleotidyltransferase family protein [Deltaproteobacteria bacterium]|nr:nucleotidyltransferase family protein [Deltaproteobacteria bacterium]
MSHPALNHARLSPAQRALAEVVGDFASPAQRDATLRGWAGSSELMQLALRQHLAGRFADRVDQASALSRSGWRAQEAVLGDARCGSRIRVLKRRAQAGFALRALADAGLRANPLKGLVLAERYYEEEHHREMGDLDILVAGDFDAGLRALLAAGAAHAYADPHKQEHERKDAHQVALTLPLPASMILELHWRLYADMRASAVQDIAAHAVSGSCAGAPAWLPAHEHHLVLCAHHVVTSISPEPPCELRWWLDLDQMVRAGATDWDRWARVAIAWGIPMTAALGLIGAVQLFGSPVPERVWSEIERAMVPMERRVLRLALREGAYDLNRDVVMAALWLNRTQGHRTRSVARLAITPRIAAKYRKDLARLPVAAAAGYLTLQRIVRIARAGAAHLKLWLEREE